ncbi:MAG: shikimate kinase [Prolixibacteraceae bacterium]|nr:shikimate kinase [Prolixibacteraceae bacterium]
MRIYLLGYMGSGKSTFGRMLAKALNLSYIDLDKYIEERNCKTVAQLFGDFGEDFFRKKERIALAEVSQFTDVVIATGGGAPCFFDNMAIMNQTGITIFMDITPKALVKRLLASKTERPLIKGKSKEELLQFVEENLEKRRPFYMQAQIHTGENPQMVENILAALREKK